MNDHLIKELRMIGLRLILKSNAANIKPTPIATPVKLIMGILEARYRKPETIINNKSSCYSI